MKKECYTCKYDKDCHWDDCLFGDTPTRWEPAEHYKPDTNADRIRAMSDEELADLMAECNAYGERADASQWLPWLKQPAEEEKTVTEGHR